jgi:hypothetical protein
MLDRVAERRRAAQLARHYRDEEGLSIAEIARRLGRAEATIKAYLYDPSGDKARAVKARYQGVCRGCGAYTQPRNGKGDAYAYCKACHPGAIKRRWTRGDVLDAMLRWRTCYGQLPSSYDWSRTHAGGVGEMRSSGSKEESGHQRASLRRCSEHGPPPAQRRCVNTRTAQRHGLDAIPAMWRCASRRRSARD